MARIRTIKPEFWDSPDTAGADLRVRLLYIAMWNWANDYGIGDASPVRLIGFAFPRDEIPASDYPRLLADVSRAFGVVFFEHGGRPYYVIPAWDAHQRTEKKARLDESLLLAAKKAIGDTPAADQGTDAELLSESVGLSAEVVGGSVVGTGEQGNRGTEEEDSRDDAAPKGGYPAAFEEWWQHYPNKRGKRKALAAWQRARKRASDRDLIDGASRYANDPNRDDRYTKYPEGWLNEDRWLDPPLPPRRGRKPDAESVGNDIRAAAARLAHQSQEQIR